MRYSASEKLEIIRLVEQSHLPVRRTPPSRRDRRADPSARGEATKPQLGIVIVAGLVPAGTLLTVSLQVSEVGLPELVRRSIFRIELVRLIMVADGCGR